MTPPLVVVVLGGAAGPWGRDGGPLQAADAPVLRRLAATGRVLGVRLVASDADASSAAPLLALLGYDPAAHARAPASYLAPAGAELGDDECFCCADFVSLFRDVVADVDPGPFRAEEERLLLEAARRALGQAGFRLHAGTGARHVAAAASRDVDPAVPPPEAAVGRDLSLFAPAREAHARAHRLSRQELDGHDVNAVRRDLKENGADMVWLWGPGGRADLSPAGPRLAVPISACGDDPVFRGVCHAARIALREGDPVAAAADAIAGGGVFVLHVADTERAARRRDEAQRRAALEATAAAVVEPLARLAESAGARLLVACDRARDASGRALPDPVPVLLWGKGVRPVRERPFAETIGGDPLAPGHGLLAYVRHV